MISKSTLAKSLALMLCASTSFLSTAQNMETFESVTASGSVKQTVFVNAGQSFTVSSASCANGGTVGVFIPNQTYTTCSGGSSTSFNNSTYGVGASCAAGVCSGTSAKFIDANIPAGLAAAQTYAIKTTNSAVFTVKNLHIFLSSDLAASPSNAGGVTFVGRIGGNNVFSYALTTGFNTSFGLNNGFTYINFASGGYSVMNIDELQIITGAGTNYFAIDNFAWGPSVALPLTLTSFTATAAQNAIALNWVAAQETAMRNYEVERSGDGKNFNTLGSLAAANEAQAYRYEDYQYLKGTNYYRLKMIDQDGSFRYSPVVQAQMAVNDEAIKVFPNPAIGKVLIQSNSAATGNFQLIDMNCRVVRTVVITGKAELDMTALPAGIYQYRVIYAANGQIQQGKLVKR